MNKIKMRFGAAPEAGWNLKLIDRYFEVLPKTGNYSEYVKKYTDFLVDYVDDQIDDKEWFIMKKSWAPEGTPDRQQGMYDTMLPIHFTIDILDYTKYKYDNNMDEVSVLAQIMNRSKYKRKLYPDAVNFYKVLIRKVEKYTKEIEKSTSVKLTKDESKKINKYVLYKNKAILKRLESDIDFISKTLKTFKALQSNNKEETVLENN